MRGLYLFVTTIVLAGIIMVATASANTLTHVDSEGGSCGGEGEACQTVVTGTQTISSCCEGLTCNDGLCEKPSFFGRLLGIFKAKPRIVKNPEITVNNDEKDENNNRGGSAVGRPTAICCEVTICYNKYSQEFICQDGRACYKKYDGCHEVSCEPPQKECPSCGDECDEKIQTCKVRDNSVATHVAYKTIPCEGTLDECKAKYGNCECGWEEPTCEYNGREYSNGDTFPAGDGCNTCTCSNGRVYCSKRVCDNCEEECQTCKVRDDTVATHVAYKEVKCCGPLDECKKKYGACECGWKETEEPKCEYNGKEYDVGDSFPAGDGCNTCSCSDNGQVICTQMACANCEEHEQTCYVKDNTAMTAVVYKKIKCEGTLDECKAKYGNCECGWEEPTCEYNGNEYKDGEIFKAEDGCNECKCSEGKVECTDNKCEETCSVYNCQVIDPTVTTHVAYKTVQCEGTLEECEKKYGKCECQQTLTVSNNLKLDNQNLVIS